MKKALIFTAVLICILTSILIFNSCGRTSQIQDDPEMNIVGRLGVEDPYLGYDTRVLSGAVEMAQLIGQFKITGAEHTGSAVNALAPVFTYTAVIEKIYFDRDGTFKEGQEFTFISLNGYIRAIDYINDMNVYERTRNRGLVDKTYEENDYFLCSSDEGIPYETGKTYLTFLCDNELGDYIHASDEFVFGVDGRNLLYTTEKNKYEDTLKQFEKKLKEAISNRKGELDDGMAAYFKKNNVN